MTNRFTDHGRSKFVGCWQAALVGVLIFGTVTGVAYAAVFASNKVTAPTTGATIWKQIPDPSNSTKFLSSFVTGGVLLAIPTNATSVAKTATWTTTGLQKGYYKVESFYQRHTGNAKDIAVQYKTTKDTGFLTRTKRLDQTIGTPSTVVTTPKNGYLPVYQNVTPYTTSNAQSYIWVDSTNGNNGTLAIRFSNVGCVPGKTIVADVVRLTWMGGTK